jgi:hypothetical protein
MGWRWGRKKVEFNCNKGRGVGTPEVLILKEVVPRGSQDSLGINNQCNDFPGMKTFPYVSKHVPDTASFDSHFTGATGLTGDSGVDIYYDSLLDSCFLSTKSTLISLSGAT